MGAPSINISFIERGTSAITRGERGIVMLWVKDAAPGLNPFTVMTESDMPAGLSDATKEQIRLAMAGHINAPKKIIVYCMDIVSDADTDTIDAGYKKAMDASTVIRFDYLVVPTVDTDGKTETIAEWVKTMRASRKKIKAVLPDTAADCEGVINFTTEKCVKTETVTGKDGIRTTADTTYTAAQYCARIAGMIAGTPLTMACTYAPLPELSDCTRLEDNDAPVDRGELILFHDGEKVKVVRGVNSLTTTTGDKGASFKKIKIVEAMDMIHDDIVKTAQDSYLGKHANTYSNKCLLITAISNYFAQLKRDDIISGYSVGLDTEAIRGYLRENGKQAALDSGETKAADECSDEEIKTADTGANVFLTGAVKILDAIEDIRMPIYI